MTSSLEAFLSGGREPFLDFLAVALRSVPEGAWRQAGGAAEGANEIREIVEAAIERNIGDGAFALGEQPCRALQAAADEILMRRDAERLGERAQEVEPA